MSTVVHVRRTIVVEYDVDREDYDVYREPFDSPTPLTDNEIRAIEEVPHGRRDGWSIYDLSNEQIVSSKSEVTFR